MLFLEHEDTSRRTGIHELHAQLVILQEFPERFSIFLSFHFPFHMEQGFFFISAVSVTQSYVDTANPLAASNGMPCCRQILARLLLLIYLR